MKYEMYVFTAGRLTGLQNVSDWTVTELEATVRAIEFGGSTAEISDKGRLVCYVCRRDLGEIELPAGQLIHGYCDDHFTEAMASIS
uniref:Uncharacterized protein n=1 Tax=viral metagenome TaxID=1070528 RepID=A0A6H2A6B4_9ZZZZ